VGIILKGVNGNAYQISARKWLSILKGAEAKLGVPAASFFKVEKLSAEQCRVVARAFRKEAILRNRQMQTDKIVDKNLGTSERQLSRWMAKADSDLAKFLDESGGLVMMSEEENERIQEKRALTDGR
jgi:hypothetical protein